MADFNDRFELPLHPFGRTGLQVTSICLGCAPLTSMPPLFSPVSPEQAFELLRTTFKSPLHFLDTAAGYGDGESERRIGVVLKEMGGLPAGFVLASKADRDPGTNDFSGEQTRRSFERSLELLGLDQIDILYIHDPENATTTFTEMMAPGGVVEVLQNYKAQRLIKAIGVAGGPIDLMLQFVETDAFDAVLTHNRYNLINRSANRLIEVATKRGMAVVNAAVYGGGMLAKGPTNWSKFAYREASTEVVEAVRQVEELCKRFKVSLGAAALQFSLRDTRITSTVVGMTRAERVRQTLALAQESIPDEFWSQLEELVARANLEMN